MLNPSQLAALKADILADPILNAQPNNSDGAFAIKEMYNATAVPDFWAWKTRLSKSEIVEQTSQDGTVFNWTGVGFIGRSQGERDAWRELFEGGTCSPSLINTRQAFADIFSGATPPAPANRAHLLAVARRKVTRVEKLFATGAGTTVSPSTMVFEGNLDYPTVQKARSLP